MELNIKTSDFIYFDRVICVTSVQVDAKVSAAPPSVGPHTEEGLEGGTQNCSRDTKYFRKWERVTRSRAFSPGWCGSKGWSIVLLTERLHNRSQVKAFMKAADRCFSLTLVFLSLSPPSSL